MVVTGVVLPRRLLVGGGSAGGGAPVDVALVHEGRTWPCQKCAQQDEEKEGIEKRAQGCVSSPESEEGLRRRGGLRRRIPAAWGRGNEGEREGNEKGSSGHSYRPIDGRGQGVNRRKSRGDSSHFCPRNHRREEEDGVTSRVTSRLRRGSLTCGTRMSVAGGKKSEARGWLSSRACARWGLLGWPN